MAGWDAKKDANGCVGIQDYPLTMNTTNTVATSQTMLTAAAGEGGVLTMTGANGANMFLENINGTLRLLNNTWTVDLFHIDQGDNANVTGGLIVNNSARISSGDSPGLTIGPSTTWGRYLELGGWRSGNNASIVPSDGNLHIDAKAGHGIV
ncbi:hypothetical protein ACVWZK_001762 [Bradyrhizobium sp. GM0.4]